MSTVVEPLRILHVMGGMDRAGVETWLMHVLRHIDRDRFRMDFLVPEDRPYAYGDLARSLGSEVIPCLKPSRPWSYARNFAAILRDRPAYDVVHSHVQRFGGLVLRLADRAGVPARVAHSHLDDEAACAAASLRRRGYLALMNRWIRRHSTARLAASRQAATALFGPAWPADARCQVLHYGLDLAPFAAPVDRREVRAALGIPEHAFVVGHVGRFEEQKNHAFVVEVAEEVARRREGTHLLLVGIGPLRAEVGRQVARSSLAGRVVFAGSRPDVPALMKGAMDAFLFPSRYEGLGLVAVEAQAAGLPVVLTDTIPDEADVVPGLTRRLSLAMPASSWAEALIGLADRVAPAGARSLVEASSFAIGPSVRDLGQFYQSLAARRTPAGPRREEDTCRTS